MKKKLPLPPLEQTRRALGLSQAAVARLAGCSQAWVSLAERGEAPAPMCRRIGLALETYQASGVEAVGRGGAVALVPESGAAAFARERRDLHEKKTPGRRRPFTSRARADILAAGLLAVGAVLAFSGGCASAPPRPPAPPLEPGTVGHLAAVCSGSNLEYCAGASKMIFDALYVSRAICPAVVTLGQIEATILESLRDLPPDADAVTAAVDALRSAWPCGSAPVSRSRVNAANAALSAAVAP